MGRYPSIAASKQKTGAARGKLYSMYAKEIYQAAKTGGTEPVANPSLKRLIERAKKEQVPSDIIKRAIDKVNSDSSGYIPDYMLAIPEQVQGMAFTKTDKIIFSTSYGRKNNSKLYIYEDVLITEKSGTKNIDGKNVDLYACSNELLETDMVAPPMAEGLAEHPDGIYIIFESGAAKYRNGNGKYPVDTAFVTTIE